MLLTSRPSSTYSWPHFGVPESSVRRHIMAVIITWAETDNPPIHIAINDEAMSSLDKYRLTMTRPSTVSALEPDVPIYPDVLSMVLTTLTRVLVQPAFQQFPTDNIKNAADAAAAAASTLAQAE